MAIAITPTQTAPAAAAPTPTPRQTTPTKAPSKTDPLPKDIVNISTAAQTAAHEATESRAQTAQEANRGDQQAARLLAKESAAKKA